MLIPSETDARQWQEELTRISPRTEQLSWLYLAWEPGDEWQPINRWIIWNMLPRQAVLPAILAECEGPHPRSTGRYDVDAEMWKGGPCRLIDKRTWELYRETGRYGRRWWTIQGSNGGHRFRLSDVERTLWRVMTGTNDTPSPGDLPYAPFDNRVKRHLLGLDKTLMWLSVVRYGQRNAHKLDSDEKEEVRRAKEAVANWLANQMDGTWDEYGSLLRRVTADVPAPAYQPVDEEQVAKDFGLTN